MCFLCPGKPPIEPPEHPQRDPQREPAHDPGPGPGVFKYNPLPPSIGNYEVPNQQKKVSESDGKPPPKQFSPNTKSILSSSPMNSDSDDTKDKMSKKTSSPDRKVASSETAYPSNPLLHSTDHFPKLNSDSNKPTTRKMGHESKLSPSPPPAEPSENNTHRFPTSDEVTRNTTESPTKAQDERNANTRKTSSNNKKLMRNEKEHTESPKKDAASSLLSQTVISDCDKDPKPPDW